MGLLNDAKNLLRPKTQLPTVAKSHQLIDHNNYVSRFQSVLLDDLASFTNLTSKYEQARAYRLNPVLNAIINVGADAHANCKWIVKSLKDNEQIPLMDYDKDGGKLRQLLCNPNPLQSGSELDKQFYINYSVFGNGYLYASVPVGYEDRFTYKDINVLNNLPPVLLETKITGDWIDATDRNEIIKEYHLKDLRGNIKHINPNVVMHLNEANIDFDQFFTEGVSKLISLERPLSNIQLAYESRNVLIKRRGAIGMLTPNIKDEALGSIALDPDEERELQNKYRSTYGGLNHQNDIIISKHPMTYTNMARSVKELMLFEEIEADAIAVCNSYGVPVDMVRYYIKNGGLANETNASERRLYDSTVIPQAEDRAEALNNFLKLRDENIELIPSFEHVKVLQSNKKDEAVTRKTNTDASISAFMVGALTYDDVLASMGLPDNPTFGSLRVWDLDPEKLEIIGIINRNGRNNQDTQGENQDN